MEKIFDNLTMRLGDKGFLPIEISRLIKDVLNIINLKAHNAIIDVNKELEQLGWGIQIMDHYTYELIIFLLENRGFYEFDKHINHRITREEL